MSHVLKKEVVEMDVQVDLKRIGSEIADEMLEVFALRIQEAVELVQSFCKLSQPAAYMVVIREITKAMRGE